ncbi:Nucleotidyl transferase [Gordonia westfalica]|uniref:Nucleotidyl transferase n=1 Tax=Gordonia westfalica TaxID=158898 RepID=A0A1H2J6Y3_9ACTN|nr:Nucleotidyl transferase [Gordonia westfalica]
MDQYTARESVGDESVGGSGSIDKDVQAVVLVGGKGTRLRPLTLSAPKPMLPTAGLPFLTHLLSRIHAAGIRDVVLSTSFKAEVFSEYYGDGSKLGLRLRYVTEDEPLGTGGGIRNVLDELTADTVVVFNGDVLGGTDVRDVIDSHRAADADVTIHLVRVSDPRAFGCVPTDGDGRVTAFLEKTQDPPTDQINAGTYVFKREIIESIPYGVPVSVEREVFPRLLTEGKHVHAHVDHAYWRDMGTPRTSSAARPTWCAASRRHRRSATAAVSRWSTRVPASARVHCSSAAPSSVAAPRSDPAPGSTARWSSTARSSRPVRSSNARSSGAAHGSARGH